MQATIESAQKQTSIRQRIEELVDTEPMKPTPLFDWDGSKRRAAIIEHMEQLADELALPYPDFEIFELAERTVDLALSIRRVELLKSVRLRHERLYAQMTAQVSRGAIM
jgi:hypothetical protein